MEELPKSHFHLTYDEVIIKAQSIQPHFAADLIQFNSFDPWFTSAINTELLSGIFIGLKDFAESSLITKIKRLNDLLDLKLAAARHCYHKLNYFVEIAFKDVSVTLETFKYRDFESARNSVKKMIPLLNLVNAAILKDDNQIKLLAVGMPLGLPPELANIVAELASAQGVLKIIRKQHLLITRELNELYNSIWDILVKICEDAKNIFTHDPARLSIYELYNLEDWDAPQVEQMERI